MIYIILASFISLLIGFVSTRIYHVRKIRILKRIHKIALNNEFHAAFSHGYEYGMIEGEKKGRIEQIRRTILTP